MVKETKEHILYDVYIKDERYGRYIRLNKKFCSVCEKMIKMNKIKKQKQDFLKALKTIDDKICDKCGQKLPEDHDDYESRYT